MERAQFPEKELFQPGEYLEGSFAWEDRAVYLNGPLTIVPMTPVSRVLERNGGGGFYYAIVAGELLETGLLDLDSPLYRRICQFMEQRGGFVLGMTSWLWQRGIDHAYTYGYLLSKIREDNVPRVLLGFYGMLAYGMSRDTFAAGEVVPLITGTGNYGQGKYGEGVYAPAARHHCQPHGYSNSQQLRLLRNMLVREEGNDLLLGFTVPGGGWTAMANLKCRTRQRCGVRSVFASSTCPLRTAPRHAWGWPCRGRKGQPPSG